MCFVNKKLKNYLVSPRLDPVVVSEISCTAAVNLETGNTELLARLSPVVRAPVSSRPLAVLSFWTTGRLAAKE